MGLQKRISGENLRSQMAMSFSLMLTRHVTSRRSLKASQASKGILQKTRLLSAT